MPNLTNNLLLSEDQGYNIRKMMQTEADDLKKDLQCHIDEIFQKLISIMVDSVKASI